MSAVSNEEPVCVAVVPQGQIVDWTPGSYAPEIAIWIPDSAFDLLLEAFGALRLPTLAGLNPYMQTRVPAGTCRSLLVRWHEVEKAVAGTPGEPWAMAFRSPLEHCAQRETTELLIEGP